MNPLSRDGVLPLTSDQVLAARMIETVLDFEGKSRARLAIRVWPGSGCNASACNASACNAAAPASA